MNIVSGAWVGEGEKRHIEITNFDSAEREFIGGIVPRRATESAEHWYAQRMRVYATDYSAPWFYAAKLVALAGIILVCVLSMAGVQ